MFMLEFQSLGAVLGVPIVRIICTTCTCILGSIPVPKFVEARLAKEMNDSPLQSSRAGAYLPLEPLAAMLDLSLTRLWVKGLGFRP